MNLPRLPFAYRSAFLASQLVLSSFFAHAADFKILQPLGDKPMAVTKKVFPLGGYYIRSTVNTVRWGHLPNQDPRPVLSVPSGSLVTFDTVSHEGILEDQGKDPVKYFGQFGIKPEQVLDDAKALAASSLEHDFVKDGPHIVTGPVEIEGAKAGDVLKVEMISLQPRVPYGVISNRHGKGALPGEFPEGDKPDPAADAAHPELFRNVSTFVPIREIGGKWYGMFFASDPHFVQADGEVALTALEGSLRSTFRLTVLKLGDPSLPLPAPMKNPFAETKDYWIPIGLNADLDDAMKDAVRQTILFLEKKFEMDRAGAMAYASVAVDFQVSQVVDRVKGVNGLIRKQHFPVKKPGANAK